MFKNKEKPDENTFFLVTELLVLLDPDMAFKFAFHSQIKLRSASGIDL